MALPTILELVKKELPFLSDGSQDAAINTEITMVEYFLQPYLKIADADVEDESKYTPLQRILIAYMVAYNLLGTKAITAVGGTDSSGSGATNKFLKKGKADVVEAEFEQLDIRKTSTFAMGADALMATVKDKLCNTARSLRISLPMCACDVCDDFAPFRIVYDCE